MLGGIAADFVRQPQVLLLPPDVQEGVKLHRRIDSFTDSNITVRHSIGRLSHNWHWFSGIIVDIYYDHILACEWSNYSDEPLDVFSQRSYDSLNSLLMLLPEDAQRGIGQFISDDRLFRYTTLDGIEDTLARVSDRIEKRMPKHAVRLEQAMPDLAASHAGLVSDFRIFYPELIAYAHRCKLGM